MEMSFLREELDKHSSIMIRQTARCAVPWLTPGLQHSCKRPTTSSQPWGTAHKAPCLQPRNDSTKPTLVHVHATCIWYSHNNGAAVWYTRRHSTPNSKMVPKVHQHQPLIRRPARSGKRSRHAAYHMYNRWEQVDSGLDVLTQPFKKGYVEIGKEGYQ